MQLAPPSQPRSRAVRLILAIVGLGCLVAEAQPALASEALAGSCVVVQEKPQTPAQQPSEPIRSEALQPPREQEIKDLAGVLRALASAETSAPALAALGEGRPFPLGRFALLLDDVRTVVAQVHARELLDRVSQSKGLEVETVRWIENHARVMEGCASARFETRGGAPVYEQVRAIVGRHRGQLEPYLFQDHEQQGSQPPPVEREKRKRP